MHCRDNAWLAQESPRHGTSVSSQAKSVGADQCRVRILLALAACDLAVSTFAIFLGLGYPPSSMHGAMPGWNFCSPRTAYRQSLCATRPICFSTGYAAVTALPCCIMQRKGDCGIKFQDHVP
jgi:hypothetical protein